MADHERSQAERDAARLERERRRTGVREDAGSGPPSREGDERWDAAPELDDDDLEAPLGVRRVTRAERAGGARPHRRPPRPRGRARSPRRRRPSRPRPARALRGLRAWFARAVILLVLALAGGLVWFGIELYQPFGTSPHGRLTLTIPAHASARQIGDMLARDGIVPSGFFFNLRAKLSGRSGRLLPGTYHLAEGMSYAAALRALTTPPPPVPSENITMTPGERRVTFSRRLRSQGVKGDYLLATRHSRLLDPGRYGAPPRTPSLEGFLFPDTYQLRVPVSISALVADQLTRFKQEFATVDTAYAASRHLTPYDVLIIASLVQAEAFSAHDMPLVASVIYNRLHDAIPLGIDSTTRYATGNFTGPLTRSELEAHSPYNTRTHPGLPPTPIDSPDLHAIQAAAHPPDTTYLYFVNKPCSTALAFSSSYAHFLHDVAAFDASQSQSGRKPSKPCR